jgi:hypothetical protein
MPSTIHLDASASLCLICEHLTQIDPNKGLLPKLLKLNGLGGT